MKRFLKWLVGIVVVLLIVLVIALTVIGGHVIKIGVEKGGEFALQVPVHLKKASLSLISFKVELKELIVENPEGYKTPSAIEAGRIYVHAPIVQLVRAKPRIETILVEGPVITLEQGAMSSNLVDLMNNVQRFEKGESEDKPAKAEKKIVIGKIRISDAKVNLSTKISMGKSVPILLPPIELDELGGEDGQGITIAQAMALSLNEIVKSAVSQGGNLMPKDMSKSLNASVASLNETSKQLVGAVGDAGQHAAKSAGKLQETSTKALGDMGDAAKGLFGAGKE